MQLFKIQLKLLIKKYQNKLAPLQLISEKSSILLVEILVRNTMKNSKTSQIRNCQKMNYIIQLSIKLKLKKRKKKLVKKSDNNLMD